VEVVNREGGVDMVVDHIGGSHLARAFKCLRPEGTLVSTSSYAAALGRSDAGDGGRADPFAEYAYSCDHQYQIEHR
jgi:NADPH:quinone reductase-like Zn-dependent oxidoreductase